jgi:integrase
MITSEEIQAWLDSKRTREGEPLTAVAFNTYRRYLSLFFMFCLKRGWVSSNPLMRVNARKVSSKVPRLLSPEDLKGILDACPEEMKPVLAIQAFCGVRVAESARLTWSDLIETKAGCYVQIGADSAKTSRRRLTPVPEGVAAYLRSVRKPAGYVYPAGRGNVNVLQKAIQHFRQSLRQVAWGRNALRASALSYRLALTKDAAATALEMGNSPTILMRDYRELTTPAVAKDWFSVSPA